MEWLKKCLYYFSAVLSLFDFMNAIPCVLMWVFRFPSVSNSFPHTLHLSGLSLPIKCAYSSCVFFWWDCPNNFSQKLHLYCFPPVWTPMWLFNVCLFLNFPPQMLQLWLFSRLCSECAYISWAFLPLGHTNIFGQNSHFILYWKCRPISMLPFNPN